MTFAAFSRRALSVAAAAALVAATFAPVDADARAGRGGSFGSRGSRTFNAPPPTATAPGAQQMQRSTTQPGGFNSPSAAAPRTAAQPGGRFGGMFGGGLMGGLMGGLLGAGLFGLLSGSGLFGGLGSLASMLGLVIQIAIVFFVVRFAMNWFRNRNASVNSSGPVPAGAASSPLAGRAGYGSAPQTSDRVDYAGGGQALSGGTSYGGGSSHGGNPQSSGSYASAGAVDVQPADYDAFEKLLGEVQDAWSRQDLGALRGMATPEMVQMFADDLAELSSDGVLNKVTGVKLLQGDLAESWNENGRDYATVAMRYELIDVTEDVRTHEVVDGDPSTPTEATELWTFMRTSQGGRWLLSAVQQSEEQGASKGWLR